MGRLVGFECDFAQGYLHRRTATAAEVTEALGGVPFHRGHDAAASAGGGIA